MKFLRLEDLDVRGKRLLIRQDLNVPVADGRITSDARLRAALPTLKALREAGASTLIISHLGRPRPGVHDPAVSLAPVAAWLTAQLDVEVPLLTDWIDGVDLAPGALALGENTRFLDGEKGNDEALARRMSALCDVFVMDAFGTAHRSEASTCGVARFAPIACAGPLLAAELDALGRALEAPARPLVVIVGGSKVSTKLAVLERLAGVADQLIIGGGIANTFLAAEGRPVGRSLHEPDMLDTARRIRDQIRARGGDIPLPDDVVVGSEISAEAHGQVREVADVESDEMILDIGPNARVRLAGLLEDAGTIVWNGPVGVFEHEPFAGGTRALAEAVADSAAYSLAGGGDTLAAIDRFGVRDRIDYVSTGGGAFLEFLEGRPLPAVAALAQRAE